MIKAGVRILNSMAFPTKIQLVIKAHDNPALCQHDNHLMTLELAWWINVSHRHSDRASSIGNSKLWEQRSRMLRRGNQIVKIISLDSLGVPTVVLNSGTFSFKCEFCPREKSFIFEKLTMGSSEISSPN